MTSVEVIHSLVCVLLGGNYILHMLLGDLIVLGHKVSLCRKCISDSWCHVYFAHLAELLAHGKHPAPVNYIANLETQISILMGRVIVTTLA